jgi:ribose-phosphate pyrophosphokinase
MLLGFADSGPLFEKLATALHSPAELVEVHRFPDGESRVTLPTDLPENLIICRSLNAPNEKLVELMLTAQSARDLGVHHIALVAPYLCYMRQDVAFHPGEAVSQHIVGKFLAGLFDAVVTVDPHLHRTASLAEAVPAATARAISAAPLMGEFLAARGSQALLMGPDIESGQWVSTAAERAELNFVVATKIRLGDRDVEIELPEQSYRGVDVVLIDDIASTGRTLAEAAQALKRAGAARVDALVTHALFADNAVEKMHSAGIEEIWSSDSIPHPSNAFSLANALATALQ